VLRKRQEGHQSVENRWAHTLMKRGAGACMELVEQASCCPMGIDMNIYI